MARSYPLLLAALAVAFAGCAWKGTRGSLFETPSTSVDLPFTNVGVYLARPVEPCDRDDVPFEPPSGEATEVMAFANDGGVVYATSEGALRGETDYWVFRGNYVVEDGDVRVRVFTPGGDSGYSRVMSSLRLIPTGPGSFYYESVRVESFTVRYGVYEDRPVGCFRQPFVLRRGENQGGT